MSDTNVTLHLVRPEAADPRVRRIYDDTRRTLHLPWIGALFQAYALYPDYLTLAWRDIKAHIHTTDYETEVRRLSGQAREGVDRFVVPVRATREAAQRAGLRADQLDNLDALLRLFAGLLPGLILNVAMFYRAIT